MAPPVLTQITRGGVTAVAVGTFEGFFSRVYPLMLHQVAGLSETLVAFIAFIGSLASAVVGDKTLMDALIPTAKILGLKKQIRQVLVNYLP